MAVIPAIVLGAQRLFSAETLDRISKFTHLKYPYVMIIFIIVLAAMLYLMRMNLISFKNEEEKGHYIRGKRWLRIIMSLTRTIMLLCIFLALATPFAMEEKVVQGDLSIVIMADNTTSFQLFDTSLAGNLKKSLEMSFPAQLKYAATGDRSNIADGILAGMKGNDNILLVSDGNNNYGKNLRDVALFVANLNSTINAVYVNPVQDDTNVVIGGLDKAVRGTELTYAVKVTQVGKEQPYHLNVMEGRDAVMDEDGTGTKTYTFTKNLGEGFHKLTATVTLNDGSTDYFPDNNIYYKSIEILPRPKIFVWSKKESYFYSYMMELFNFGRADALPDDLNSYTAVIMNDLNLNEISANDYDRLVDFVLNGSGLVVYGGQNSYDKGNYRGSIFESILPVKSDAAEQQAANKEKMNVIIVIDVSDSTGSFFNTNGGDTKVDVEKSLAISVLDYIKKDSQVGVVAFNTEGFMVWPLGTLTSRYDIEDRISRLNKGGGTDIAAGINKAMDMFNGVRGSNNMIIISDGVTNSPPGALAASEMAKNKGISVFTVGVGVDTSEITLKNIANSGGGYYYRPTQSQKLKIIFGEPDNSTECTDKNKKIVVMDPNNFITEGIDVEATLTGHNYVAPKSTADVVLATCDGKPIMTTWRYGLGRVVAMSTDDGSSYKEQGFRCGCLRRKPG
ncbi:MAG: VWA domain-containing protein [Candidatus Woesearchaeota archaeon]|nr:VWA domain-containing protein [Candidatus Woesearchaeota archaeon]